MEAGLTFADIGWLREVSGLPVVVKGVLRATTRSPASTPGRLRCGSPTTAAASSTARCRPPRRWPTWCRRSAGGPRSTSTAGCAPAPTCWALALGARAVFLGRPVLYGLAIGDKAGVEAVLRDYTDELARAMALCGATTVDDLTDDLVAGVSG